MQTPVILIGPIGTGKTTIGRLLADKLNLPFCSIDDIRGHYYEQLDYDQTLVAQIAASEQGIRGLLRYAEPFDAKMVARIVTDYPKSIIDFGGSNSVYDDPSILAEVEAVLAPYPNVIFLLPSADTAESAQILKERLIQMLTAAGKDYSDTLFELNDYFIQHESNYHLARNIVYTKGKTAEAICDEIMAGLSEG